MKNYKLLTGLALASAMLAPTAQAQIEANVALTSDYVWRGVSQNGEDPAIQGGFDYAHDSGFYLGVWGANVDFGGATTELDLYAGWGMEFDSGFGIDLGIVQYTYHGGSAKSAIFVDMSGQVVGLEDIDAGDNDFTEYYVGLSYYGFGVTYYAGDEFDDNIEVSYGYDFDFGLSLAATYGDYETYSYYQVGVSTEVASIGVDLSYWDTDVDGVEEADGRAVLTLSKSF